MKHIGTSILIAGAALGVQAEEFGRVLSATPVFQQIATPRQVCTVEKVLVPGQKSGAGAAVGAIAGGVVGSALGGGGRGNGAAALLGMVGGAVIGDRFEEASPSYVQDIQRCSVQNVVESRVSAYNVTYEFNGKQYTTQMPSDPGPTIALRLLPADPAATVSIAPAETIRYVAAPVTVYQAPYYPSYRPPIGLSFRWGDEWGHGHRHGWH
jgi:uncharacterized protein YcfJ